MAEPCAGKVNRVGKWMPCPSEAERGDSLCIGHAERRAARSKWTREIHARRMKNEELRGIPDPSKVRAVLLAAQAVEARWPASDIGHQLDALCAAVREMGRIGP